MCRMMELLSRWSAASHPSRSSWARHPSFRTCSGGIDPASLHAQPALQFVSLAQQFKQMGNAYGILPVPKANSMANRKLWHIFTLHTSGYWPGQPAAVPELSKNSLQDILQPGTGRSKALDWAPEPANGDQQGGTRAADTRVGGASG